MSVNTITSFVLGAATDVGFSGTVFTIDKSVRAYDDLPKTVDGYYYYSQGGFQHLFVSVQPSMTQNPINIKLGYNATRYVTNNDTKTLVNGSNPVYQLVQVGVRDNTHTTFLPFNSIKRIMYSNTGDDPYNPGDPKNRVDLLDCTTFQNNVLPVMDRSLCTDLEAITTSSADVRFTTATPTDPGIIKKEPYVLSPWLMMLIIISVMIGIVLGVVWFLKYRRRGRSFM